ncbi:helix-turn-helix domain-containing protein [Frankia sp. AgPm24]|uniref:helix-turn-helix domain-containing protein n=1 Tax=Frankia sp. AgPm24 TaxID=631128 RepID=UPI00200F455B|nr:helix-turn-helix domain-containing protein [Frankia sp. AgPm24]
MVQVTVTGSAARRRELGACLRAYRHLIEPESVGLPGGGRRRTRGLRREELAALAGVSLTWYTGLEQGRVTPSGQVLDAVGRVLSLDAVGRAHLRRLTAPQPPLAHDGDALVGLLRTWPVTPAALLDGRLDVLATNAAWNRVFGDPGDHEPATRHVLWLLAMTSAPVAALLPALARQFRMAANLHADDARITEIGRLLRADHPRLRPWWDCRGVGAFGHPSLRLDGQPATAHLLRPAGGTASSILVLAPAV